MCLKLSFIAVPAALMILVLANHPAQAQFPVLGGPGGGGFTRSCSPPDYAVGIYVRGAPGSMQSGLNAEPSTRLGAPDSAYRLSTRPSTAEMEARFRRRSARPILLSGASNSVSPSQRTIPPNISTL